jgi:hypothetical protein
MYHQTYQLVVLIPIYQLTIEEGSLSIIPFLYEGIGRPQISSCKGSYLKPTYHLLLHQASMSRDFAIARKIDIELLRPLMKGLSY